MDSEFTPYLATTLLPFLWTLGVTYWLIRPGNKLAAADKPNARSMHTKVTPRGGGLAILSSIFVLEAYFRFSGASLFPDMFSMLGLSVVAAISYLDDRRDVSARLRICMHLIAALCLVLPLAPQFWQGALMVLACVWCINLYNFMDGIDGLAACMAMVGSLAMGIAFFAKDGFFQLTTACLIIFCSCAGFLFFNWPTAKIFLGDVGSAALGYLMSMAVIITLDDALGRQKFENLTVVLIIFAPFMIDATYTMLRRAIAGEKFWQAHRDHVYQRMALRIGTTKTLLIYIASMIVCASLAVWLLI